MESPSIGDYAAIGDGRSVALVSRGGSVDWLCWPRFDSPSLFGAIVGGDAGGCWELAPAGPARVRRRYLHGTSVLETTFETARGEVRVQDLMPLAPPGTLSRELVAEHELLRIVEGTRGEVEMVSRLVARPDYGREAARWSAHGACGIASTVRGAEVLLRGEASHAIASDGTLTGRFVVGAGRSIALSLSWSSQGPAVQPALGAPARDRLWRTVAWWRAWCGPGRGPDAIVRAKLVLKLLVYAPSGAMLAAPTTSLPERAGGDLNWDYRYCWLRDASFTMRALLAIGCGAEAGAFLDWLLHSTRLTRPRLAPLYDVFGCKAPRERELRHLAGWRGSTPVRVGNAARAQSQLDVQGEVIDASARFARTGHRLGRAEARMIVDLGRFVAAHWREPDAGIWELREPPRAHTSSRVMCWVALDRLLGLHRDGLLRVNVPVDLFERERAAIRREIELRAWDPVLQSYVETPDGRRADATLLRLSTLGFERADSRRMIGTFARVSALLRAGPGLYFRYRSPASPGEGAFGLCGFWAAEHLALAGRLDEARATYDAAAALANDVGLFAEEYDPATGEPLGNFPQAYTHVGLVNAALTIEAAGPSHRAPAHEGEEAHP